MDKESTLSWIKYCLLNSIGTLKNNLKSKFLLFKK